MSQFTKIYKELVEKLKKDDIWKEVSIPKVLWKEKKIEIDLNKVLISLHQPPINPLEKYINLSEKKVKLILERRFYKSLYNFIKRDSMEIEDKILKLLFQGIENKYSPEKCLFSL